MNHLPLHSPSLLSLAVASLPGPVNLKWLIFVSGSLGIKSDSGVGLRVLADADRPPSRALSQAGLENTQE